MAKAVESTTPKIETRKRPKATRTTPAGFKHDTGPIHVGLMAAEFLPADPALWLDAAAREGMVVAIVDGRLCLTWSTVDPAPRQFLIGWLAGTIGGEEAVYAYLSQRPSA